jgi:hypothetical protein
MVWSFKRGKQGRGGNGGKDHHELSLFHLKIAAI